MVIQHDSSKPIYVQIAEWLENEIISGQFGVDEKVYSQYQLADMYNINPATAAKGLNLLADREILYKKRGLGMFVAVGAKEKILQERKSETLTGMVEDLVLEAGRLGVGEKELLELVRKAISGEGSEGQ